MKRSAAALALAALAACGHASPKAPPRQEPPVAAPVPPPPVQPRPEVLVARARALRAEGDVAGARARLEAALQAQPGADEVRLELADLLVADGRDLARADALLAGVADRGAHRCSGASPPPVAGWSPAPPCLHLVLARLAEARGDDAAAAAEYPLVLAADDDPDARLRLERLGRAEEAVAELERVRAARPDDAVARSHLAERYEAAGRLADAEAEYRTVAEAQPERAAGWERLARFYDRAGRHGEARVAEERARAAGGRPERTLRPLLPSKR